MNTQMKAVGLPWLPLIAVIFAGSAWVKLGAMGLLAVVFWFVVAHLVSKTSRTAALVLSIVLLPAVLILAAAAHETKAALDKPASVVATRPPPVPATAPGSKAEVVLPAADPSATSPVEICKKNYVGVNPEISDSAMIASGMCESVNRQGNANSDFARCVLTAIKSSRSDVEFQESLRARCNPIYNP